MIIWNTKFGPQFLPTLCPYYDYWFQSSMLVSILPYLTTLVFIYANVHNTLINNCGSEYFHLTLLMIFMIYVFFMLYNLPNANVRSTSTWLRKAPNIALECSNHDLQDLWLLYALKFAKREHFHLTHCKSQSQLRTKWCHFRGLWRCLKFKFSELHFFSRF